MFGAPISLKEFLTFFNFVLTLSIPSHKSQQNPWIIIMVLRFNIFEDVFQTVFLIWILDNRFLLILVKDHLATNFFQSMFFKCKYKLSEIVLSFSATKEFKTSCCNIFSSVALVNLNKKIFYSVISSCFYKACINSSRPLLIQIV